MDVCNLTAQCGLYYLLISTNGFNLSVLMDTGATHSFVSSKVAQYLMGEVQNEEQLEVTLPTGRKVIMNKVIMLDLVI